MPPNGSPGAVVVWAFLGRGVNDQAPKSRHLRVSMICVDEPSAPRTAQLDVVHGPLESTGPNERPAVL